MSTKTMSAEAALTIVAWLQEQLAVPMAAFGEIKFVEAVRLSEIRQIQDRMRRYWAESQGIVSTGNPSTFFQLDTWVRRSMLALKEERSQHQGRKTRNQLELQELLIENAQWMALAQRWHSETLVLIH